MTKPSQPEIVSHGVQALIDDIREKGVNAGKEEAARIVADAEARAEWIVRQAREQAEQIRHEAETDARFIREAGADALRLAMRDVQLKVRDELSVHLAHQLQQIVGISLQQSDTLAAMLATLAARLNGQAVPETVTIPATVAGIETLRAQPQSLTEGNLPQLLAQAVRELLNSGVQILQDPQLKSGCVLAYAGGSVQVELTEAVLSAALMAHLQPRFRALLEGVVS